MHFSKVFSLLAAGALVVPSLSYAESGYHMARRWVDQEREGLQAAIRSLDAEWALERRDLQVELRSLDLRGEHLFVRASAAKGIAKASSRTPESSSHGKQKPTTGGHASHKKVPMVCSAKPNQTKKPKRPLAKRVSKAVEAGYSSEGGPTDELVTWSLKTCIGIAATREGGIKALAHINGINNQNQDYRAQLQNFRQILNTHMGKWNLEISFPDLEEGPANLHETLGEMIVDIENFAREVDPSFKAEDRPNGAAGQMVIREDNKVEQGC